VSAVQLTIVQPSAQETILLGAEADNVTFAGQINSPLPDELVGITLFYRWYSSLFPAEKDRYSMNVDALTGPPSPFITALKVGTHVITFAASDQAGETEAAQNNTQHGGVTGGGEGEARRLIHVLVANLVKPSPTGLIPTLSKANSTLEAEAPLQWGRKIGGAENYEPNPDYHNLNRIHYCWRFIPRGSPTGRHSADLTPTPQQLTFVPDPPSGPKPLIRYQSALPDILDPGDYTLILRVEDLNDNTIGHEISRNIVITT
jgi:hypothetical protein